MVSCCQCEGIERQFGRKTAMKALRRLRLAARDAEQVRIIELRFFAGLTVEETAHVIGRSPRTIKREWRLAKAWLYRELRQDRPDAGHNRQPD